MGRTIIARIRGPLLFALCASGLVTACTLLPPVQEMSDARQAIRAALDANAREYAPESLQEAEGLMDQATRNLDQGAYEEARREAAAAREQAILARNLSVSKVGSLPTGVR